MAGVDVWFEGELSTRCVHEESGAEIFTDAPKDNKGLGRVFSPTDLVAASLGSCVLTLFGIVAKRLNLDLKGTRAHVTKEMQSAPLRRIGALTVEIYCPQTFAPEVVEKLIKAVETCPVHHSLHPDIVQTFVYHWGV